MIMKKMNWIRSFATVIIGAIALCACDKTNENPEEPTPPPLKLSDLKAETIEVNGKMFQSSAVLKTPVLGEKNIRIALTPSSGIKAENPVGSTSVIEVEVSPELIGKELDLATEKGVYALAVSWSDPSVSIDKTNGKADENLVACKCLVTEENGKYELFLICETKAGDKFTARATADRTGNPETEEIVIGDKSFPIKSKIATDYEGGIYIAVSTIEGKETLEQIAEENWMGIYVNPSLLDKEFDLTSESTNFTVSVYLEGLEIDVANGWSEMITEGRCLVKKIEDGTKYEVSVTLTTTEGITVSMSAVAPYTPGEQGDGSLFCYSADGAEDPCRAAFYMVDDDMHNLYFTSAGVSYFEDMIEQAYYFAWVGIDKKALTGQPVSFTSASSDVAVYIYNNLEKDEYGDATIQMVDKGTITATKNSEGNYTVSLDCSFQDGSTLRVEYDGEFKSVDVSGEDDYTNTFTYNENTYAIQSVYIEKNSDTKWTVYVSDTDAKSFEECKTSDPVILEIPPLTEENTIFGFSNYVDIMSFSYKGRKWQGKEDGSGDSGTVEGYITDNELTIRFESYDGLSGEYKGSAEFVQ